MGAHHVMRQPRRYCARATTMMRRKVIDIISHTRTSSDLCMIWTCRRKPIIQRITVKMMPLIWQLEPEILADHHDTLMGAVGLI